MKLQPHRLKPLEDEAQKIRGSRRPWRFLANALGAVAVCVAVWLIFFTGLRLIYAMAVGR